MRYPFIALLFLTLAGCASVARIVYPLNDDPLKAVPGSYELDPTHANIIFSVNHLGFSLHHGRFNQIEGSLVIDPAAPQDAQLYTRIDMASVDTNSEALDNMLRADGMFDSENYPYASFESARIQLTSEKTAEIVGNLTIRGIRKEITLSAEFIGSGTNPATGKKTIGFSGKGRFKRSDFNLKQWLPLVGDEVNLILEAEFTRAN
ncbi:YceI family protein [Kordiimonas laminariae]|uniref:YceI family protein n=1 Tax=Kordiimonas laminariae TaxID=2917717 RepID=UPI001FF2548E|nr:YceI family protein [Kordiimonas laminariae]MCK0070115.1 YceI family protein [Kordiimonas laminariae]